MTHDKEKLAKYWLSAGETVNNIFKKPGRMLPFLLKVMP